LLSYFVNTTEYLDGSYDLNTLKNGEDNLRIHRILVFNNPKKIPTSTQKTTISSSKIDNSTATYSNTNSNEVTLASLTIFPIFIIGIFFSTNRIRKKLK
jgi:hypothetical protein